MQPMISVIIATYNWSSVLQYAIKSVLAQTFTDLELLVVGDCCTDDSETVVNSFNDARVSWHNLETNHGNQFAPNNFGLELAKGQYIAYLGHDDLWHPNHLANLIRVIEETRADLVYALTEEIGPPEKPTRTLAGLCASGAYEWSIWAPPSSWLHRKDLTTRIGLWRDFKTIIMPTDVDFLDRVYEHGCRIIPVNELTVFKFPSVLRTNSYLERRNDEQTYWWQRLNKEPDLPYRELIEILQNIYRQRPDIALRFHLPSDAKPGSIVTSYRTRRGLPTLTGSENAHNNHILNRSALRYLNAEADIGPEEDRLVLHGENEMPIDGLFVGLNWHSLETDNEGLRWRWIDKEAQIVITRPSGLRRKIQFDLIPGPGIQKLPCLFQVRNMIGNIISQVTIEGGGVIEVELSITDDTDTIFTLGTEEGGRIARGDPRVLNFRIFNFRWVENSGGPKANPPNILTN